VEPVASWAACKRVVAAAEQAVGAAGAGKRVGAREAGEEVATFRAVQDIGGGVANEQGIGTEAHGNMQAVFIELEYGRAQD
jgi:hypothetical protein